MRLVFLAAGLMVSIVSVAGFGSEGIDRFAKKWAMMKVRFFLKSFSIFWEIM